MAATFDVADRLAEGQSALSDLEIYVTACQSRGFHNLDLTLHAAQVRDWYGTEDGLDLVVLDADCVALRGIARGAAQALAAVRDGAAAQSRAWSGAGGQSCADFLRQHHHSAEQLAVAVTAAADGAEQLRDELWRAVDGKVAATAEVAARAQRASWLPAAQSVLAGDVTEAALAVVDGEVLPFVADVIATEWLSRMRAAVAAVGSAYQWALRVFDQLPPVQFEIPGDLGPRPPAPGAAVQSVPLTDDWPGSLANPLAPLQDMTIPAGYPGAIGAGAAPTPATWPMQDAMPTTADSLGGLPPAEPPLAPPAALSAPPGFGGLPDLGGLASIPARLADAFTGLAEPAALAEMVPDPLEPAELDELGADPDVVDEAEAEEPGQGDDGAEKDDQSTGESPGGEDGGASGDVEESVEVEPDSAQTDSAQTDGTQTDSAAPESPGLTGPVEPTPPTAPKQPDCPQPVSAAPPEPESGTPCEMAASELPQVGG